jgi:Na+-driven multidrug efflux pump
MTILILTCYGKKYPLAGTLRELFSFDAVFVKRFFVIAAPVILNEFLWSLGITMQNVIFARTGTDAIAAFNITGTVASLAWVVFIGLGNGASVLIGKRIGEGNEIAARDYARRITRFSPLVAAVVALFLVPASFLLPFFFDLEPAVFAIIRSMFIMLSLLYPIRAFNMSMVIGVCRAGGDTRFSVFFDVFFMWTLALPLAAFASFVLGAPVWVIYLCVAADEPFKAALGWWRLKSGRWLHNVT